ncbi:YcbX family protein [Colwellia sp. 4_MG-2023]|uniref:YcbX family protein n=1 Tax=unclassified Colwellia TaxID=196834 RepID=UPI001C08E4C7|nr:MULTISPECIES: YcbX family protein [unclassified Colwellia]MBU2925102.1 YcbX family protein [Colwellia sp. C2M11]MDO6506385.1 YcbX family protein [Colwellia sp. 5_MG-2023]MDO6555209.1 YcbX family protein [Colwellia sp. 4_MG-2023]MDO6651605.1 YcbX family protein [Colwellia sp. 3_MG-2023]MDO6664997.1 YcbX family protein [Colwellia sp. 2_MG-2023]
MTKVSSIHIYPIKSTAGISLPNSKVEELGLAFDRRFIVCDPSGQFITARTEPKLCLVQTTMTEQGVALSAPNMEMLTLSYQEFTDQYHKVMVWGDEVNGQFCSQKANNWFSDYLQRPCELLYFGKNSHRERKPNTDNARKIAFADGYPILLISKASLNDLNKRLLANSSNNSPQDISMAQFRPNIVVDDCLPFAEDSWQHIRIGEVEFKVSKPCERCIFTTVNPSNGEKHPQQQPLKMLKSFRQDHNGEVLFGQNLIALNKGTISQGDTLTVLNTQKPPTFISPQATQEVDNLPIDDLPKADAINDIVVPSVNKKLTIAFEKWNKSIKVSALDQETNEQAKTLLEHGEDAGLILPYSCRAGMCGRCRAKLISGEVRPTSMDDNGGLTALEQQEGYILCCISVAMSDVVIDHT